MQEDNILSLFDNIEVKNTERISETDKTFCETLQIDFNKVYAQITAWREHILSFIDPCPNPAIKVMCRATVNKDIPYNPDKRPGYDVLGFSPLYAIRACSDQLLSLCKRFENEIIAHFNSVYGCKFESRNLIARTVFGKNLDCKTYGKLEYDYDCRIIPFPDKDAPLPSYNTIIDYIIEDLQGKSFKQMAKELAYDNLQKEIRYDNISTVKNRIKITSFCWFDSWDNKLTYESKNKLHELFNTINQHFDWPFNHTIPNINRNMSYGEDYVIFNSPCESFKIYKNRTLELSFKTQEQAQSFAQLCESLKQKAA